MPAHCHDSVIAVEEVIIFCYSSERFYIVGSHVQWQWQVCLHNFVHMVACNSCGDNGDGGGGASAAAVAVAVAVAAAAAAAAAGGHLAS
ncbi:unnamed protein product [Toxocara canis]|uniref:Uncharacterized protein n=1 Tax=Toxocara canis TaxID=6265 RepID=A0A183V1D6_TOXCA|nr:unnamed protein product [Toxocara canis]